MLLRSTPRQENKAQSAHGCAMPGCAAAGEYKAPRSRQDLKDYMYLCLDHVREYNKKWDYFDGMGEAEIEAFRKDAVTGHRPTWLLGKRRAAPDLRRIMHNFYEFLDEMSPGTQGGKPAPRLPDKQQKALAVLNLEHPTTLREIKARYKVLVKQCHPDLHKGNRKAEETFKAVGEAYRYLCNCGEY